MTLNIEFYDRIHKLEEQYGSITNVPENNSELTELQNNLNDIQELTRLLKAGYSGKYCMENLNVSKYKIGKVARELNVPLLPSFIYHDKKRNAFATSKNAYVYYLGIPRTDNNIRKISDKLDYGYFSWDDMPVGAVYIVDTKNFYRKLHVDLRTYREESGKIEGGE